MHFRFALDLSDIDLLNIVLLHQRYTQLNLFVPKTSSRHVFKTSSRNVFKTSSRHVFKTSSRNFFKTSSRHVFKTSSRHVSKTSWRRLQRNNLLFSKTTWSRLEGRKIVSLKTCWRHLQDMSWSRHQDVLSINKRLLGNWSLTYLKKQNFTGAFTKISGFIPLQIWTNSHVITSFFLLSFWYVQISL